VKYFALPLAAVLAAQLASADIIPTLDSVTPNGINFNWNYQVNVTLDQNVLTGNYFTIYDFGPILASTIPTGWALTTSTTGTTPAQVVPIDSALLNLTLTRTGGLVAGPSSLGIFTFVSSSGAMGVSDFAALATRSTGPQIGSPIANIGSITTPIPSGQDTATPEPATFALIGLGLLTIRVVAGRMSGR
jgi:PEP-CTERM motif